MTKVSAGLLMWRKAHNDIEFFLVHPGGPFFGKKDKGWWSIPKGLPEPNEDLLTTAQREFAEETGMSPAPPYHPLGSIKQKNKEIFAWAFEGSWNPEDGIKSNTFELEWPPKSGRVQQFPENDKAAWFSYNDAVVFIKAEQQDFLTRALQQLS